MVLKRMLAGMCAAVVVSIGSFGGFKFPTFFPFPKTPVVTPEKTPSEEDVLGEYVDGVVADSQEMVDDMSVVVDEYVNDTLDMFGDFLSNPYRDHNEFVNELEKKAEDLADELEAIGEAYGNMQEINGDIFGNKFDRETAETVSNIIFNLFR